MRTVTTVLICLLLVVTTAATAAVRVDHEPRADFDAFKTYAWKPGKVIGDNPLLQNNSLVDGKVKRAVNEQLAIAGMTETATDPDLWVVYYVGTDDRESISTFSNWGYGVGPYYGTGWTDVMVSNYKEGTLVVDLVEAGSEMLVWRAYATATLTSPEKNEKKLRKALAKAFKSYPPGGKE